MSYILDALRRSQAERERGQVPGLNAQPVATAAAASAGAAAGLRWLLPVGVLVLVGAAALVWLLRVPPAVAPAATPASAGTAGTAPPVPVPVPVPSAVLVTAPATVPPPLPTVVSVPAPSPSPSAAVAAVPAAPLPPPVSSPAALPAAVAAPRSVALAELTPEQRREMPALAMGGSIWSDNALARFVMVNGQVVREGEAAAPGVMVERITQKWVLLRWRELRIEVPL